MHVGQEKTEFSSVLLAGVLMRDIGQQVALEVANAEQDSYRRASLGPNQEYKRLPYLCR